MQSQFSETQLFEILFRPSQCAEFEVITVLVAEFRLSVYLIVNMHFSGITVTVLSYSLSLFLLFGFCYMVYLVTYHNSECQKHRSMPSPSCLVVQGNLHPVHIDQSRLSHFKYLKI